MSKKYNKPSSIKRANLTREKNGQRINIYTQLEIPNPKTNKRSTV